MGPQSTVLIAVEFTTPKMTPDQSTVELPEATKQPNADPRLTGLTCKLSLLPVAAVGTEALKRFGYELVNGDNLSIFKSDAT
jgi:hypothetical protein